MNAFIKKNHRLLFYLTWLSLGIAQAFFTELLDDEAYYWVYSKFLDWGYFDHPPMIALMIKSGYAIFPNELGLRLFTVLFSTTTLFIIEKLINPQKPILFYGLATGMAVMQIGGFIAVPDIPLLFFTALFFLQYKRWLLDMRLLNTLLLGIITAGMLWSKYYGILVVFFTLLSSLSLFRKYQTWLVALLALLLFSPHLHWQYTHDYASIRFHLVERVDPRFRYTFISDYVLGQLVLPGPFIGVLLIWALFRQRSRNAVEKALRFVSIGIYIFFLISAFRNKTEANWTLPCFIGLMVLGYHYILPRIKLQKWVYGLSIATLAIVMLVRIYMVLDLNPSQKIRKDEFHANPSWAVAIKQKSNGLPVVFTNSYQRASKYWFYTGSPAFSLNSIYYRRNNFNIWQMDEELFGKKIMIVSPDDYSFFTDTIQTRKGPIGSAIIENYYSFSNLWLDLEKPLSVENGKITNTIRVNTNGAYKDKFSLAPCDTVQINLVLYQDDRPVGHYSTGIRLKSIDRERMEIPVEFPVDAASGKYLARLSVGSAISGWPTMNSRVFRLTID